MQSRPGDSGLFELWDHNQRQLKLQSRPWSITLQGRESARIICSVAYNLPETQ